MYHLLDLLPLATLWGSLISCQSVIPFRAKRTHPSSVVHSARWHKLSSDLLPIQDPHMVLERVGLSTSIILIFHLEKVYVCLDQPLWSIFFSQPDVSSEIWLLSAFLIMNIRWFGWCLHVDKDSEYSPTQILGINRLLRKQGLHLLENLSLSWPSCITWSNTSTVQAFWQQKIQETGHSRSKQANQLVPDLDI
jgi:hypothetical protein